MTSLSAFALTEHQEISLPPIPVPPEQERLRSRLGNITALPRRPNTPGAFIHIGKTGGGTLTRILRNACHSFQKKSCKSSGANESHVSKFTTYYHVPDFSNGRLAGQSHKYDFYVMTTRDPLDRTISAFGYEHPDNILARGHQRLKHLKYHQRKQLFSCFPNLDVFSKYDGNVRTNQTDSCTKLARSIFDHQVPLFAHLHWDMQRIVPMLRNTSSLLILRNN